MRSPGEAGDLRRLARLGLLIALAGALQAFEGLLPLPVPWFRLGLANALVLAALDRWGWREGLWVALGKVLVGGLLSGRLLSPAFILSLGGTLAATGVMALAARLPLGFVGVSALGAQAHAWAQLALARWLLLRTPAVWGLAPLFGALALAAGVLTGAGARAVALALDREDPGPGPASRFPEI